MNIIINTHEQDKTNACVCNFERIEFQIHQSNIVVRTKNIKRRKRKHEWTYILVDGYRCISSVNRVLSLAKLYSMMVVFKTDMGLIFQKYTSEGCEISEPECDWVSRGCGNRVTRKKITKYSDGLRRED